MGSRANVTFIANDVCHGDQTTLTGSSTLNDSLISSWNWDLDNDGKYDDATGKTLNYLFSTADTFPVGLKTILVDGSGDSLSTSIDVVINPLPDVNFQVDNLCQGKTAKYIDQSTITRGSIIQYRWDFNNDGNPETIDTLTTVYFTNGPAGKYTSKLECVSDKNCKAFATKSTDVYEQPIADISVASNCVGVSTIFTNNSEVNSDSNVVYIWSFGDGDQDSDPGNPSHTYTATGTYTATLYIITENNCRDADTVYVEVNAEPTVSLSGDTLIYEGSSSTIEVEGNADTYSWSNGSTSSSITVSTDGIYSVVVTDLNGCLKTLSTKISIKELSEEIGIENDVLTPNNDGINDYFLIEELDAYSTCQLTVYNIWNDQVFSTLDYNNDWSGESLPAGSYFYILKCDDKKEKIGNINLLK